MGKSLMWRLFACFSWRPEETCGRNPAHLSTCPPHPYAVMAELAPISPWARAVCDDTLHHPRETVPELGGALLPPLPRVFITVSARNRDKHQSLRAVKASFHRQAFLSSVCLADLLSIIRP